MVRRWIFGPFCRSSLSWSVSLDPQRWGIGCWANADWPNPYLAMGLQLLCLAIWLEYDGEGR